MMRKLVCERESFSSAVRLLLAIDLNYQRIESDSTEYERSFLLTNTYNASSYKQPCATALLSAYDVKV